MKSLIAFIVAAIVIVGGQTAASATTVTQPTGTTLAVGTTFKGTNAEEALFTTMSGEGLWRCTTAETTGEVLKAGGGGEAIATFNITASQFKGTGTSGDCTSSTGASFNFTTGIAGGLPYCMKSIEGKDELETRGGKCSESSRPIKFTLDFTGIGSCGYEIPSLKGTFTTDTVVGGDVVVRLTKAGPFKRYESEGLVSVFCPSEMTQDMSFTLEKDETPSSPIFIS